MLKMPETDKDVMARRVEIAAALREIVPGEGVITEEAERRAYESDGLTGYRQLPMIVVLPETTEQISEILKYCNDNNVRVVPRGAGTSLSGGALPLEDGVLLGLGKFNRVLEVDEANRAALLVPSSQRNEPLRWRRLDKLWVVEFARCACDTSIHAERSACARMGELSARLRTVAALPGLHPQLADLRARA